MSEVTQDRPVDVLLGLDEAERLAAACRKPTSPAVLAPTKTDTRMRAGVLEVAAQLTSDPRDAAAVVMNARPLLAWLEAAAEDDDGEDLKARYQALREQWANETRRNADDNPDRFLAEAVKLYEFLASGQEG
jgi:hypothetical protein